VCVYVCVCVCVCVCVFVFDVRFISSEQMSFNFQNLQFDGYFR
jgi:hypothetical protein